MEDMTKIYSFDTVIKLSLLYMKFLNLLQLLYYELLCFLRIQFLNDNMR